MKDHTRDAQADRFSNLRTADGERANGKVLSVEIRTATANELECTRLGLHADDTVYRIHRVRQHRGHVFLVEDVTLPAALFPGLAASKAIADSIGVLAQEYGILLGKVEERISMGMPPAAVANTLLVAPDTPVMVLDRVVFMLDDHRPVEWRLAHCHLADAYYLAAITLKGSADRRTVLVRAEVFCCLGCSDCACLAIGERLQAGVSLPRRSDAARSSRCANRAAPGLHPARATSGGTRRT